MRIIVFIFIFIGALFSSCSEYTPKPKAFARIERDSVDMLVYASPKFSFEYPNDASVEPALADDKSEIWLNISYPRYNATIHCTYLPLIKKADLRRVLEDNYQLVYSHVSKADEIQTTQYTDSSKSGIVYDIKGLVAVPVQFFITDNSANFFRGSLYYDGIIDIDSVAPLTNFLRNDIIHLMETIEWSNASK